MNDPQAASGRYLRFVGWLREDGTDFRLDQGWETPRIMEPPPSTNPHYRLDLLDREGRMLISVTPHVDADVCQPRGGRMKTMRVLAYLPWRESGTRVQFSSAREVIHEESLAPTPPEITWEDAHVSEGALHLRWRARHSKHLTYAVAITQEKRGAKLLDRFRGTEAVIPLASIPFSGACRAVVLATDGLRSQTAESESFDVGAKHPVCVILQPRPDETFSEHEGVPLVGNLIAPDGRSLPLDTLRWRVGGVEAGQGGRFGWVEKLPVGRTRIDLSCTASAESTAHIYVNIRAMNDVERAWQSERNRLTKASPGTQAVLPDLLVTTRRTAV